ncbi:hypothetical protein Tco_1191525 [Tanacetum coccineum]
MSTSNTHQQSLTDAAFETRPPMLERGSYIPWASRFRRYLNRKTGNRKWLNKEIDEGPYEFKEFTHSETEEPRMQKEEDLRGDDLKHYEAKIEAMNLILISIPNDIYNYVDACTTAQAMWQRVEHLMRGTMQNKVDRETRFNNEFDQFIAEPGEALVLVYNHFAQLMNDLERNGIIFPKFTVNTKFINCVQPEWLKYVTQVRLPKRLTEDTYDDLFDSLNNLRKCSSSRTTLPYYVTHHSSVVDYDDEYQRDAVQNTSEDPLTSAMILLARAITQRFSNLTNNRLRTSSNTRNQAIVQEEIIEGNNVQNDAGNIQRTLQTTSLGNAANNDFLFVDASRMEEIKELSVNICLMARIQPANFDSHAGPSYDSAFLSEESQSQFIHDRDIIRYLEQLRDTLKLSVVELKRKNMELQKTQSILKRRMSENEEKYHDTVLDLEAKLKKECKPVNTKFDKDNVFNNLLCVTPINKKVFQKKVVALKTEEKHVLSKIVTLQISPKQAVRINKNVIALEMYKVDKKQTTNTNKAKSVLSSTGLRATSSVRRPSNRDSSFKNSVLSNTKNSSEKVEVFDRSHNKPDAASKNVALDKKIVTNDDIKNTLITKNVLCVSCVKNVLIPCHNNCIAKYKLNVHLNVKRALFTTPRAVNSMFKDTTLVVLKTRFYVKIAQSKSLDTTPVVSKTKIVTVTPLCAKNKVYSTFNLRDSSLSNYMKNKI